MWLHYIGGPTETSWMVLDQAVIQTVQKPQSPQMAEGIESSSHWEATATNQEATGRFGDGRLLHQQRHQSLLTQWEQPSRTQSFMECSQQDSH